jgi:hypothetical protein
MLEANLNPKDKDNEGIVAEQRKEVNLIASQRLVPGLKMWKFNPSSEDPKVEEVPFRKSTFDMLGKQVHHQVAFDPNCYYVQALNLKNAIKKFQKYLL